MRFRYLYFAGGSVAAQFRKKLAEKIVGVNNGMGDLVDRDAPLHRVKGETDERCEPDPSAKKVV